MTVGNTPATGGQSEFTVQGGGSPGATKAIFKGAPVAMQTAAGGAGGGGGSSAGTPGLTNTGGGGSSTNPSPSLGGAGGSGIVLIAYPT